MVITRRTDDLDDATLREIRALLDEAFGGDFGDEDWAHGLGGIHALVRVDGELVAHGSLVQRTFHHRGSPLRAGYVESVAVAPEHRRRGHGDRVMVALEALRSEFDLLALSASEEGIGLYVRRGWQQWRGPTSVLGPHGVERTPEEDGSVYVLPGGVPLDLDGELTCEWRPGDVW